MQKLNFFIVIDKIQIKFISDSFCNKIIDCKSYWLIHHTKIMLW